MALALVSEDDTRLILDCSEDFLIHAVEVGRIQCLHVNQGHMFMLDDILHAKREMQFKGAEFFAGVRDVENATHLDPAYF